MHRLKLLFRFPIIRDASRSDRVIPGCPLVPRRRKSSLVDGITWPLYGEAATGT